MQKRRVVAAAVAALAAAMLTTSAGAGSGGAKKADLSTNLAVAAYLTSIDVDPATVLIQRGLKNYAGPRCPGATWNCTTATNVVQVAQPGGENRFECGDAALFGTDPLAASLAGYIATGSCFVVQDASAGTNVVDTRRKVTNGTSANCDGNTQTNENGGQNHFKCHLVIHVKNDEPVQTADESASVKQIADGGGNHANVYLEISLTSTLKSPTVAQKQNAWQRAVIDQEASAGAQNHAVVTEKQFLRARIRDATESDQYQNTDALPTGFTDCVVAGSIVPNPNSCALITQQGGSLQQSQLNLLNDLDMRTEATSGTQNQGGPSAETPVTTGLDGSVPQPTNGGTDHSREDYDERHVGVAGGPGVVHNTTAPQNCCALQIGAAPNSTVNADQKSVQRSVLLGPAPTDLDALDVSILAENPSAVQATLLAGKIQTDGHGTLTHDARQDDGSVHNDCEVPEEDVEENGTQACALVTAMVNGVACEPGEVLVFDVEEGFECREPVILE